MIGEIALGLLEAVCITDSQDVERKNREDEMKTVMHTNETNIKIEKERTKQQIIGGIFDLLSACASESGTQNTTSSISQKGAK